MNKKTIRIILMSLLSVVFVVSVGMMVFHQIQYRKTVTDAEEAALIAGLQTETESRRPETAPPAKETVSPVEKPPEETASPPEETASPPEETMPPEWYLLPEEARDLVGINLEALRAFNTDVVGWIAIPGTVVSYPLVQGTDNQYYLTHNWKRERITSGSAFLSSGASRDLTDFNTIVYGHHMRNGTMFGTIEYYFKGKGTDYWRDHPSVYIVLDDMIYRYDIFSAQEASVDGIVYRSNIEENHLEEEFLQSCKDRSVFDTGLSPEAGDRILTLSTCTGNRSQAYRWVIHGVLAQEYRRTNM